MEVEEPQQQADAQVVNMAGFKFVQELAGDLNRGDIKLPSFPDVVMRIKRAIEEQNCDSAKLARIVTSEPALAARLLNVANSALMQRGGKPVKDIKTAVARLGLDMLHSTAVSVAVEQIFLGASIKEQRERLRLAWRDAAHVAAFSYTLARRTRAGINPDEALLAGLLHNVGKLYIVMNAGKHRDFLQDPAVFDVVVGTWHGQIGRAILEAWEFSEDMAASAAEHMDLERSASGAPDLTDIVTVACLMTTETEPEVERKRIRAFSRLRLDEEKCAAIKNESIDDINALAQALNA